jgi:thioredoxin 2
MGDDTLPDYLANTELPVVIDFWAEWCGPCRVMAPHFEAAAKKLPEVRFVKVDSDENPRLSGKFGIRGIPTLILVIDGREVARRSGATPAGEIVAWIQAGIATAHAAGGNAS